MFVPPTPGGKLAKELKRREMEINQQSQERIKIGEKSGINIERILSKKNPFKKENCSEKMCPICPNRSNNMSVLCNTNNVGYKWVCNTCQGHGKNQNL